MRTDEANGQENEDTKTCILKREWNLKKLRTPRCILKREGILNAANTPSALLRNAVEYTRCSILNHARSASTFTTATIVSDFNACVGKRTKENQVHQSKVRWIYLCRTKSRWKIPRSRITEFGRNTDGPSSASTTITLAQDTPSSFCLCQLDCSRRWYSDAGVRSGLEMNTAPGRLTNASFSPIRIFQAGERGECFSVPHWASWGHAEILIHAGAHRDRTAR